jgi:hypothetical protein
VIYRGHIKNGMAVPDTPLALADGTAVRIEVDRASSSFWSRRSLDELAGEQQVVLVDRLDELAIDWPVEDSADELLALVREVRR